MKQTYKKGERYFLVFVLFFLIMGGISRLNLANDPEGGNLLVHSVGALIGTGLYVIAERFIRMLRKKRGKSENGI